MTEAEALKRFIPILARISTPYERATIVMRVNERINAKDSTHLLGVTYRHIAALAWPSEPARAKQFEDKLTIAVEAGEFVSLIRDGKHLQIEELLAWPDCPSIAPDSPLTFWLGEPVPATDTAPAQTATTAPVSDSTETTEQRQDRRLRACIDAGLPMNDGAALSRLPYGVGDIAKREGVTRQAFSTDVRAALKRRASAQREGVTVHRT